MSKRLYIILYLCLCVTFYAQAQVCQTVGNIITTVTTDHATGYPVIQWSDPANLNPAAVQYIIYEYLGGSTCTQEITRVPITQHSYTHPVVPTAQVKYTIAVDIGTAYPEPITHEHGAAFIYSCTYNPCDYSVALKWNAYAGWNNPPTYRIYGSSDGISWDVKGTTTATEFAITNTPDNVNYKVYVAAVNADDTTVKSLSNIQSVTTATPQRPAFINLQAIDYQTGEVVLTFAIDASADPVIRYAVQRAAEGSVDFQTIYSFSDKTQTAYRDAGIGTVYNYRIIAVNTCDMMIVASDTLNNMLLDIKQEGSDFLLAWSALQGSGVLYDVVCIKPALGNVATGLTVNSLSTPALDMSGEQTLDVCYRIVGHKAGAVSITAACADYLPQVVMPDAVNPYSTAQNPVTLRKRNQFGPVLNVHPATYTYRLEILSRNGTLIARIDKDYVDDPLDKSWTGTHQNGEIVREDVYLYSLKITYTTGVTISKTGTVTVVTGI